MMSTTPRRLGQPLPIPQLGIKGIRLLLGTLILPIRTPFIRQRPRQLLCETAPARIQRLERRLGVAVPEDAAVLLAGAGDALDAAQRGGLRHGGGEAGEDEVEGF